MQKCKCGSYALNIDLDRRVCDVCFWKDKYEKLKDELTTAYLAGYEKGKNDSVL